jgi:lysophospholipase L1-like esterase
VKNRNISKIFFFGTIIVSYFFAVNAANANKQESGADGSLPHNEKKVLIVGASYAKHWDIAVIAGHNVINRGVAGSETGPMLERLEKDIRETKPAIVIIWGFINDIFRSKPEMLEGKIKQTKENIEKIIEITQEHGITPVVATEVTITSKKSWVDSIKSFVGSILGKKSYADYINKHVTKTNNWLRNYAAEKNVKVLDFERVLADENGERKKIYAVEDGSHLSKQAYDALTVYMQSISL